jgi:DNA-binding response OmpR family regulator
MSKILIVEDDQLVANVYRNKFTVEGFQVEVANDAEGGLEMMPNFLPDAVILDLLLPRMTGVELVKRIRAQASFRDTPLIIFSNTYLTNMVQEAWKAGANKCLSKANCTPKQLIEVVRSLLGPNGSAGPLSPPIGAAKASPEKASGTPQAAASPTPSAPAAPAAEANGALQADLRRSFINSLPATLASLRALLQTVSKAESEELRLKQLHEMCRRVHTITTNAAVGGLHLIAQMADALEALVEELHEKPKNINASSLRTTASAIDFLASLFERGLRPEKQDFPVPNILVVDDEPISLRAVTFALEKAKLKSVSSNDPVAAAQILKERSFDLIFLDIDMPGMSGFELCAKLREFPAHKKTPVVFVTSLNDFENRAQSTMSGGNDFIAKPFVFMELAVKALIHLLRARVSG